jgi:P-type Cu2+ transporter
MAAAEGDSEHMIAAAIREEADERGLSVPSVREFEALEGRGVRATIEVEAAATPGVDGESGQDGETVYVGGPNLLRYLDIEPNLNLRRSQKELVSGVRASSICSKMIKQWAQSHLRT